MAGNHPSKKQRELLNFIDEFIQENGYSPSYREIMRALNYKSVSTVAVHVDGLIVRGFLKKREHSARSLEVVSVSANSTIQKTDSSHIAWLKREIKKREADPKLEDEVKTLKAALSLLDQTDTNQVQ